MHPVLALVGRPNVGKSTLFNALTRSRRALVADEPGLTRDRQYGLARIDGRDVTLVDTGGLSGEDAGIDARMAEQTSAAIAEADAVLLLVDAHAGLLASDELVIDRLRRAGTPFCLVVNKIDGVDEDRALAEFAAVGAGAVAAVSAARRRGLRRLDAVIGPLLPPASEGEQVLPAVASDGDIRVAVVGRPNVGKSTLINRLVGEERLLAFDTPGTTRDAVEVPFERDGQRFILVDTAGLRRRGRVHGTVEKFSAVRTLEAIRGAHVVILVLDAHQGLVEQDQHLAGHVIDVGRGLVLAVNKWDGLDREHKADVRAEYDRRFGFLDFASTRYLSALHGTGVGHLLKAVRAAHDAAGRQLGTPELTQVLEDAVLAHPPPRAGGGRIKLRYAHQGGTYPPRIIVHGSRVDRLPASYRRYIVNTFRRAFGLQGTPIHVEYRAGRNPYAGVAHKESRRQADRHAGARDRRRRHTRRR